MECPRSVVKSQLQIDSTFLKNADETEMMIKLPDYQLDEKKEEPSHETPSKAHAPVEITVLTEEDIRKAKMRVLSLYPIWTKRVVELFPFLNYFHVCFCKKAHPKPKESKTNHEKILENYFIQKSDEEGKEQLKLLDL
jgi:hypothetical protein